MKANAAAVEIITRNEGCKLESYQDTRGIWTIGFGHIAGVHPGMTISQARADELLREDLRYFEAGIAELLGDAPVNENQFGAMVSLTYNIGLGDPDDAAQRGFADSSILSKHIAGDYQGAADAFLLYDKSAGQVLRGLARRRREERTLYLRPHGAAEAQDAPEPVPAPGVAAGGASPAPAPAADAPIPMPNIAAAIEAFDEAASNAQVALKALGLYRGRIDGIWGKQSQAALAAYKSARREDNRT